MLFKYFDFLSVNLYIFFRSSKGTSSYCSRDSSGSSDSCAVTVRDNDFYVRVLAYSRLSNAKLEVTGGNIESVEDMDMVDQTTDNPTTITENPTTIADNPTTISTLNSTSKFSIIRKHIFSLFNSCRE